MFEMESEKKYYLWCDVIKNIAHAEVELQAPLVPVCKGDKNRTSRAITEGKKKKKLSNFRKEETINSSIFWNTENIKPV